ncbi:MAG TPA: hypothetical protein VM470_03105 [Acidimicrobiia bacterium]|nr:hypothetical protein [Acidimicrobiia bacterium]
MILGVKTEFDSVLSVVAPLGLAAAAPERPVLMIDGDPGGPPYPGDRSLAELVEEGPRRRELSPDSSGLAILRNGGVRLAQAGAVVAALGQGWPAVVIRVVDADLSTWPVIPVIPLLPGLLAPGPGRAAVWQATSLGAGAPGPGPVLPPLTRGLLTGLLNMHFRPAGRWVRAWRRVWELPWE